MNLVYTIVSGYLECQNDRVEIPFALVFLENGIYSFELILPNEEIYLKYESNHYYTIVGKTEKKYDIECSNLFLTNYEGYNSKIKLKSEGFVKLSKPFETEAPQPENNDKRQDISFVELENFKTHLAHFTHIKRSNNFGEVKDFLPGVVLDHTQNPWVIDNLQDNGNYFKFRIIKKINSENILLDLRYEQGYCNLYYDEYLKIKKDLISLLSFMNGGIVKIRKEYIGDYYGINDKGYNSNIEINYSFRDKYDDNYNDYLPINSHHSYSSLIFNEMFFKCFDKFQHFNKILELDSLIFSLTVSSQTIGLKERYFILITALEKIAKKYSESNNNGFIHIIENNYFENEIKPRLTEAILQVKSIDKEGWNRMNSIISNLNNGRSTNKILNDFLIYAKIPINKNVKTLIKKERNLAVHEGIVGTDDEDMYQSYLKLDHILRDSILNIIGYFGYRKRKYLYATEEELKNSNPKYDNGTHRFIIK